MPDMILHCIGCGGEFIFSVAEQTFFAQRKLQNIPKRCHNCRVLEKAKRTTSIFNSLSQAFCEACGAVAIVPFKAKGHKPIYCADCFAATKQQQEKSPKP